MALSDILVCLDSTAPGQARLKLAVHLACQHAAFLTGAYVLDNSAGASNQAEEVEQRFRETLRMQSIAGDWHLVDGPDTREVAALAKSVDLVIMGQYARDTNGSGFRPDNVATACGRPLLIVPYAGEFATVGKRVLIAWDGTREATRALNDALPLVEGAKTATVMTVIAKQDDIPQAHALLRAVVKHLEHHGVTARGEETMRGDMAISDLVLSRAADLGADMIVAGAFHHSQLREALIGGVSRDLLRHMTVPVLMSH